MGTLQRFAVCAALVAVVFGAPSRGWAQGARLLTLAQAVNAALERNDRLINQHDSGERAGLTVRAAENIFRPKVVPNVRGSFGQTNVSDQTYGLAVSQRFTSGTEMRVGVGASTAQIPSVIGGEDVRFYNTDTTLMVTQPLLRGFGPAVARRQLTSAELQADDASRQQILAEQQVAIDVANAYYRVVAQQSLVKVARQSFERSRQLRDASEAKLEAGLVSQLDALRAQQLVSQAELQLFDAQNAIEDARDQLRFLMGADTDTGFQVVEEIPTVQTEPMAVDGAIATALQRRLDLQAAVASANDSERSIAYSRNQLLPQVDVNLVLTRRQTADTLARSFGLDGYQFATFFNISMPVDRTPQVIDYQNSLIDRDRRRRDVETLRRRIADDVKRQLRDQGRILRNLTAADANVKIAESEVEVARLRYERGLSNNLDVVTAENNLLNAQSRRIQTQAEQAVSRLSFLATIGQFDPRRDVAAASR
jgi:outer membrane protein